jgi:hypothetical protein
MSKREQINSLIETLEAVREKPMLFVGADLGAVMHFLNGFDFGASVLEVGVEFRENFDKVLKERGWSVTPSLVHLLKENGLNQAEIAAELTTIHIETWRNILGGLEEP